MNKQNLILKMAENLGVSRTQKDLAFKIFIDKVTSLLNYGEAIKIPEIGVFQLKKEPVVAGKSGHGASSRIIFSPTYSASSDEKLSLFLTIDVEEHSRVSREYTDKIFSLGIGKPLIPVSNTLKGNVATDELYIQKSIQERINDLLARSEKLESFDLWDDYLSEKTVNNAPTFEPNLSENITTELSEEVENFIQKKNYEPQNVEQIEEELNTDELETDAIDDEIIFNEQNLLSDSDDTDSVIENNLPEEIIENKAEDVTQTNDELTEEPLTDEVKTDEDFLENPEIEEQTDNTQTESKEEKLTDEEEVKPVFDQDTQWTHGKNRDNSFWYILGVFVLVTLAGIYYFVLAPTDNTNITIPGDVSGGKTTEPSAITQEPDKASVNTSQEKNIQAGSKQLTGENLPEKTIPEAKTAQEGSKVVREKTNVNPVPPVTGKKNISENGNNSAVGKEQEVEDLIFYNGKFYSVQISSWKNRSSALKAADKIKKRGYQTEVVSADLGSRGTWHRVRIANIKNIKEARRIKNLFVR